MKIYSITFKKLESTMINVQIIANMVFLLVIHTIHILFSLAYVNM